MMTMRYFDLFKDRAIDMSFINFLFEQNYVTTPGAYSISGEKLDEKSNIITNPLPNWMPVAPDIETGAEGSSAESSGSKFKTLRQNIVGNQKPG